MDILPALFVDLLDLLSPIAVSNLHLKVKRLLNYLFFYTVTILSYKPSALLILSVFLILSLDF
jgi:hypothetical protein